MKKFKILGVILGMLSFQVLAQNLPPIRNDIERFIDASADSPMQKIALKRTASLLTLATMSDLNNSNNLQVLVNEIAKSKSCLQEQYPQSGAQDKFAMIENMLVNNNQSFQSYQIFKQITKSIEPQVSSNAGC